jgi:hypothetical protein
MARDDPIVERDASCVVRDCWQSNATDLVSRSTDEPWKTNKNRWNEAAGRCRFTEHLLSENASHWRERNARWRAIDGAWDLS